MASANTRPVNMLLINAKRWFDKVNGNTYFSGIAYHNGDIVAQIDFEYGYGDQYEFRLLQTAWEKGLIPSINVWELKEKWGFTVLSFVSDVTRKKDLKEIRGR